MRGLTLKCEWVGRGPLSLYWSGDPEIIGINSPSRPANFRPHQQQGCRGRTSDFELVIILEGRRGEERLIIERELEMMVKGMKHLDIVGGIKYMVSFLRGTVLQESQSLKIRCCLSLGSRP